MLSSNGKPLLLLKFGTWLCVCVRNKRIEDGLRVRIRPWVFAGYACWCDRPNAD